MSDLLAHICWRWMLKLPEHFYVGATSIEPYTLESEEELDYDPRGVLLMWEPPERGTTYIMGMDSSEGITGWSRATRQEKDTEVDNGVVEIFIPNGHKELLWRIEDGQKVPDIDPITRRQKVLYKDVQVAEWAGPVDAVEIARIAYVLGRVYAGSEDERCELIWESWPGCGMLTTQELLRLGYSNLWHWEYIDSIAEETNRLGWRSSYEAQKILWYRARRHLMSKQVCIKSKHLLGEYKNAEIDMQKMRARAAYGFHDDRFQAANMCFWAGHKWTYDVDSTAELVTSAPVVDFQRMAPVLGDDITTWEDWKARATDDWE
jgi:hypothetical protein